MATASVRSAPSCSRSRRYSVSTFRTRATGTGRRRRRASTPSPSRVMRVLRRSSSMRPSSTSATSSRVAFVPRSIAPTRVTWSARSSRKRSNVPFASAAAARRTASCASDVLRCSVARVSRSWFAVSAAERSSAVVVRRMTVSSAVSALAEKERKARHRRSPRTTTTTDDATTATTRKTSAIQAATATVGIVTSQRFLAWKEAFPPVGVELSLGDGATILAASRGGAVR